MWTASELGSAEEWTEFQRERLPAREMHIRKRHTSPTLDNCHAPKFFCDPTTMLCEQTKGIGSKCWIDGECLTHDCGEHGQCINQPETPLTVTPWQCGMTILCIIISLTAACVGLNSVQKRYHKQEQQEVLDYCNEQTGLRRAIISLHEAAMVRFDGKSQQGRGGYGLATGKT